MSNTILKKIKNLDWSEFATPTKRQQQIIDLLEERLGHHVIAYKSSGFSELTKKHLCARYEMTILSDAQLRLLVAVEEKLLPHGISLAVYKKPWTRLR